MEEKMPERKNDTNSEPVPVPVYLARDDRYRIVDATEKVVLGLFEGGLRTVFIWLPLALVWLVVGGLLTDATGIDPEIYTNATLIGLVVWAVYRWMLRRS